MRPMVGIYSACNQWAAHRAADSGRTMLQVIDRILYKLDELVRPYVHKILVVIEPLLIDEDYYARVEGREIIANLSKAAGLATMIAAMRPDIDNIDECACAAPAKRNKCTRNVAVPCTATGSCWQRLLSMPLGHTWDAHPMNATATCQVCCSSACTGPVVFLLTACAEQVCAQHHRTSLQRGRFRSGHPSAAAVSEGGVPEQEELAGPPHRHQDRAADLHPAGLRHSAPPQGQPLAPSLLMHDRQRSMARSTTASKR